MDQLTEYQEARFEELCEKLEEWYRHTLNKVRPIEDDGESATATICLTLSDFDEVTEEYAVNFLVTSETVERV